MKNVKKFAVIFLVVVLVLQCYLSVNVAAVGSSNTDVIEETSSVTDNAVSLIQIDETVMAPLSFFSQAGISTSWDSKNKKIQLQKGKDVLIISINSCESLFNGEKYKAPIAPKLIDGRTYVPVSFILEFFDGIMSIDDSNGEIYIHIKPSTEIE